MLTKAGNISARSFELFALSLCIGLFFGGVALAGGTASTGTPVNGCDKNLLVVAQETAQAHADMDTATVDQAVRLPDSQLAMNCFNNLAYVGGDGANGGGSLFSDDFSKKYTFGTGIPGTGSWATGQTFYKNDIEHSLTGFYGGFTNAEGNDSKMVDYTQTQLSQQTTNGYQCQQTGSTAGYSTSTGLFDQQQQAGVTNLNPATGKAGFAAPFWTFNTLTTGTAPANAGSDMSADMSTMSFDSSNLQADFTALPAPATPMFTVNYTQGGDAVCDQLTTGGVAAAGCP